MKLIQAYTFYIREQQTRGNETANIQKDLSWVLLKTHLLTSTNTMSDGLAGLLVLHEILCANFCLSSTELQIHNVQWMWNCHIFDKFAL